MSLLPLRRIYNMPRYDVFTQMSNLLEEASKGFDTSFDGSSPTTSELRRSEDGTTYVFRLSVPGFDKDEINVDVSKNHISVDAEHSLSGKELFDKSFPVFRGSFPSKLTHREQIPATLDPTTVKATLKDGVLLITVSTATKTAKGTKITIE